ncbi:EAL domain-containing protein [Vibrio coralliilyticus]|uniref:EAL domain-containing protein n=1 Tax=Vibrio coralliilyticus TaxID=190893 RepID=UPI000BAC23A4|nr:EAL domain-containing protein [Vibrio coralliilyticus]NOI74152.1 EAL domain-containing protein [Vibrio coralliilyticus]PAW04759.1 hypothetical protein CKJ79_00585 [Vibrio coralliilyticus]
MDTRLKLRHDTRVTLTIGNGILKVSLNEEVIKSTNLSNIEDKILHILIQRSNGSNPVSNRELDKICREDYKLNIQFNTIKNNLASLRKKIRELLSIPQNIELSTCTLVDNRHGKGYLISDYWILERDEEIINFCDEKDIEGISDLYLSLIKTSIYKSKKLVFILSGLSISLVMSLAFIQISYVIGNYEFYSSNTTTITRDILRTNNVCFKDNEVRKILSTSISVDHMILNDKIDGIICRLSKLGTERLALSNRDLGIEGIQSDYIVAQRDVADYQITYFYERDRISHRYQRFNLIPSIVGFNFHYDETPIVSSGSSGINIFDWRNGHLKMQFSLNVYNVLLTSFLISIFYIFTFKYKNVRGFFIVIYALTGLKLKFESVYNKSTNTHVEYTEILSNFNKLDANIVIKNMKKIGFLPRYTKYLMQCVPVNGCYSINICPSMLMGKEGESFIHYMSGLLNKNQIIIEITENSKISFCDGLKHRIEQLRELGFKIAIDDFGVGNNNLELLKDLTIDYVKIDKKFILNILESKNDKQYFYHIVRLLSSATDAKIIAEGVETQAHSNLLTDNDVYLQQGYYFT